MHRDRSLSRGGGSFRADKAIGFTDEVPGPDEPGGALQGGRRVGTPWGERRRYAPLGTRGASSPRLGRWLVALAAAGGLVALRAGALSWDPGGHAVETWVAKAAGTPMAMKAPWEAALSRVEGFLRGGLDGRGWHWPPADGGMRVRESGLTAPPMTYPVAGVLLVPFGGGRDPVTGKQVASDGIVLGAQSGSPVQAPCSGTVTAIRSGPPVGEEILLRPDQRPEVSVSLLGVAQVRVHVGQSVERGAVLGTVASVGPREVPSVVMEVRIRGIAVDPLSPLFLGPSE